MDANPSPLAETSAKLSFLLEKQLLYWDVSNRDRPTGLCLKFIPEFPEMNPAIRDMGILLDPLALIASCSRPGGYFLLNCGCGDPFHAGIRDPVFVSHPDADTIVWELDLAGLGPALAEKWRGQSGFLRIVYPRQDYEDAIREMVRQARAADSPELPVEELEPDRPADAWEKLQALDVEAGLSCRSHVFPAGTVLEFGFAGADLCLVDGKPGREWPGRWFTRWVIHAAFERWLGYVARRYALEAVPDGSGDLLKKGHDWINEFVLVDPREQLACDLAGQELAALMQASFAEGGTAPSVAVRYRSGAVAGGG